MIKQKRLLICIIIFIYLLNLAYAQDYSLFPGKFYDLKGEEEKIEFEFYNGTYDICENEKKTIPILVINKDAKTDEKYSLSAFGASWISLHTNEFSLPKNQKGVIFLDLNPLQNTKGRYVLKVSALSSIGNAKRDMIIEVNVEKCYSLNLELEKEEDKVCGGIKKEYSGEIINNGRQESDVELAVKGPNWVSVSKNAFSVAANDRQKFELNADVPANAKGIFNAIVSAIIKDLPSISSEKILRIEVVPKYDCYKADVIADAKIANYYSNAYAPIKIRNSGIKQANYEIGLEAPNWVDIEQKKITVNPEQFWNLNLNINPDAKVPEGIYPIKIYLKSEDIVYTENIDIALSKDRLKGVKLFFIFYQYYIYVALAVLVILFFFRKKIKRAYKNYKIRRARLRALEAARKARAEKKAKKEIVIEEPPKPERIKKFTIWTLFLTGLFVVVLSTFLIYQYNFPVSKEFIKNYYGYFIAGILISLFVIFIIEFYKPLVRLLRK